MPENPELLLVFGTSADPFHLGHASLVVQAVKELAVRGQRTRQVVIMPIFRHHNILDNVKRSLPPTYQHRFDICQLFTEQIAADLGALVADVRVSDLERRLVEGTSRPNFTVETLTALRESVDPALELAFLLGADTFAGEKPSFQNWLQSDRLLQLATLVISPRKGFEPNQEFLYKLRGQGARLVYLENLDVPEIASSTLRARLEAGEPAEALVMDGWITRPVADYIQQHNLVDIWRKIDVSQPAQTVAEPLLPSDNLETRVGKLMYQRKLTLGLAESCTGGLISHRVTNVPGSSDVFVGAVVSYAYEAKVKLLGVQWDTLKAYGAVSAEVVLEMARGIRQALGTDLGLSVSCIAGPGGATPVKPVGTCWCGLSTPEGDSAHHFLLQGSRVEVKEQLAENALKVLLEYLEHHPGLNSPAA